MQEKGVSTLVSVDLIEKQLDESPAVSVGTANFHNPRTTLEVIEGIEKYMAAKGVNDIKDLIGIVK